MNQQPNASMLVAKCASISPLPCQSISCTAVPYCQFVAQIFFEYTKKFARPAQDCLEESKNLLVRGRKAMPQSLHIQGPFLSWAGFQAVCQDFDITTAATSSLEAPASRHSRPLANRFHQTHQPVRGAPLGHQKSPKASPGASASKTTCQPGSSMVLSVETPSSDLLSGVQACIAFFSACTHRSQVASFPNGGQSDGIATDENARRDRTSRGSSAQEKERMSCTEEDTAYWRVSSIIQYARR